MAHTYIDEMNRITLPTDVSVKKQAHSPEYLAAQQSSAKKSKFEFAGKDLKENVKWCLKNNDKKIDARGDMLWFYLLGEDFRTEGNYVFRTPLDAVEAAKRRVVFKKSATEKSTWTGKTYVYSRDAETKEEFLVATVETTKKLHWKYIDEKGDKR